MNLYIKTEDGDVYTANVPCHFMVVEDYGLDPMSIIDTGFETADGIKWRNRIPKHFNEWKGLEK